MPKAKKKHVKRHWTQDSERKNVMQVILKGRKAGLTWNEVSQVVYDKGDIYISPAALQQRWAYHNNNDKKEKNVKKYLPKKKVLADLKNVGDKIVGLAPDIKVEKTTKTTPDHFALAKMIEGMIEDKVAAVLVNVKTKVNELDEQFTKAFSGIIKLEKVIKVLRDEVNSYGK
jgi:hypothetical protein